MTKEQLLDLIQDLPDDAKIYLEDQGVQDGDLLDIIEVKKFWKDGDEPTFGVLTFKQ